MAGNGRRCTRYRTIQWYLYRPAAYCACARRMFLIKGKGTRALWSILDLKMRYPGLLLHYRTTKGCLLAFHDVISSCLCNARPQCPTHRPHSRGLPSCTLYSVRRRVEGTGGGRATLLRKEMYTSVVQSYRDGRGSPMAWLASVVLPPPAVASRRMRSGVLRWRIDACLD